MRGASRSRGFWPLIAIAAAQLAAAAWIASGAGRGRDELLFVGIAFGVTFAQVGLYAAWPALGPLPSIIRWPGSVLGCLITLLSVIAFFAPNTGQDMLEITLVMGAAIGALFTFLQAPFWWLRLRHGYQLRAPGETAILEGMGETQFSLRHLLLLTTLVAIGLGIGRWVVIQVASNDPRNLEGQTFVMFTALAFVAAALAFLTVVMVFVRRWPALLSGLLLLLVLFPWSWLEAELFNHLTDQRSHPENTFVIFVLNYVQLDWLFACFAALRWTGYRLQAAAKD